jgi:hypothetical protein
MGVRLLIAEPTSQSSVLMRVCGDFANHVAEGECPFDVSAIWSKADTDETDAAFATRIRHEMKALGAERARGPGTVPTQLRNLVGKDL